MRVSARHAAVQILEQRAVVAPALGVSEIARHRAVKPAKLEDFLPRQRLHAAPLDAPQQRVEILPRAGSPLDEDRLRQRAEVGRSAPSNLGSVDRTLEVRTPESIAFSYE